MIEQPMETAPRDGTSILIKIDGDWIEAAWDTECKKPYWYVVRMLSHGCGCCSSDNEEPTAWAPLPRNSP